MVGFYEFRKQLHALLIESDCDLDDLVCFDISAGHTVSMIKYEQLFS